MRLFCTEERAIGKKEFKTARLRPYAIAKAQANLVYRDASVQGLRYPIHVSFRQRAQRFAIPIGEL